MTPFLARITIYPFKSFDPHDLSESALTGPGGLTHDREFALFNTDGKYINGKRTPRVHGLSLKTDPSAEQVRLVERGTGHAETFRLDDDLSALETRLSEHFEEAVSIRRQPAGGFPDDPAAPGPTVISTATLEEVASWYPGVSVESIRVRFRANLEIGGVPPFWEDHLYGLPETAVPFRIGPVEFHGVNPCQRCVVPPRDPETGEAVPDFAMTFRARREATLPAWACQERFNHFYRLAVNTRVPAAEAGKPLRVGDPVILA